MARPASDAARVAALLSAVRDGAAPAAADLPAVTWLRGQGPVDGLDVDAGLAAVAVALELGLTERIADAGTARDKIVRKAARAAAHRMRSTGQVVPEQRVATAWSLGREERTLPPPRALLGVPEDDGYVPFMLCSFGEEQACVSGGAAGPVQGFRDDEHGHTGRSQARRIMDDAQGDHRLREVDFHEAIVLLEATFDQAGGHRPSGWSHLLSHVDAKVLAAARELDPLRQLPHGLDVDALHAPAPLLEGPWAAPLQVSQEAVSEWLPVVLEVLGDPSYSDLALRRVRIDEIIDLATTAALDGPTRDTWGFGLNTLALLAHRAGDTEAAHAARATAVALAEGRPGQDIPWAREWISRQLSWMTDLAMRSMDRSGAQDESAEAEGEPAEG